MTFTKSLCVAFTTITLLTLTTMLQDVKAIGSDPSIKHSSRDVRKSMNNFFNELVRRRRELSDRTYDDKEWFWDYEEDAMVVLHNWYRSVVQPTATNMLEVTWDDDIASFAQEWANLCSGKHREDSDRSYKDWTNMGENLYWWEGDVYNEKIAVESWFSESDHYNFTTGACLDEDGNEAECSHYLQIAWARTQKIGCGVRRCPKLGDDIQKKVYYIVCNYDAGVLKKTHPYRKGSACTQCPVEFPRCRYNMCVTQAMLDDCHGYNGTLAWVDVQRPDTKSDKMTCPGFAPGNVRVDGASDGGNGVVDGADGGADGGGGDDDGDVGDDGSDGGGDENDDDDNSGASLAASLFAILTTTILSVTIIISTRL